MLERRQLRALRRRRVHDALALIALLTAGTRIQLATRSRTLSVGRIAETTVHHLLETPLDEASFDEDVLALVPIEGARRVAHHPMAMVLTMDGLP